MRGHKDMEWKEIPNYDGRYIINIDGDVIDLRPERNDDQHWTTKIEQRYLKTNNGYVNLTRGTQQKSKKINVLLRELFEEELLMSKEEKRKSFNDDIEAVAKEIKMRREV